jgi:DDE family transposase
MVAKASFATMSQNFRARIVYRPRSAIDSIFSMADFLDDSGLIQTQLFFYSQQRRAAKLSGHVIVENRNGLVVSAQLSAATGTAERDTAIEMIEQISGSQRITVGADKAYDTKEFVKNLRELNVTPHVAQNICRNRHSAIDNRTTTHAGYEISQKKRKRIEEVFGWIKTVGLMRQTRYRGVERVGWMFTFAAAAYNLVRIRNLTTAAA